MKFLLCLFLSLCMADCYLKDAATALKPSLGISGDPSFRALERKMSSLCSNQRVVQIVSVPLSFSFFNGKLFH